MNSFYQRGYCAVVAFYLMSFGSIDAYSVGADPKKKPASAPSDVRPPRRPPMKNVPADTTTLGSLVIPTVGLGTISWSSNAIFTLENNELQDVVAMAYQSNGAFLDTAERYGSHFKTAMGMGYGETEQLTRKFLERAEAATDVPPEVKPVVASKFTPLPWRTTKESVVKACEQSCRRLGVDSIDLYQVRRREAAI